MLFFKENVDFTNEMFEQLKLNENEQEIMNKQNAFVFRSKNMKKKSINSNRHYNSGLKFSTHYNRCYSFNKFTR